MVKFRWLLYYVLGFAFVIFLTACEQEVEVPLRRVTPRLVVEGSITTDPPPYAVRLMYSGQFTHTNAISGELYINDAAIILSDDAGGSTSFTRTSNGFYESTDMDFRGETGKTYQLTITLSDGNTFQSKPETIFPVPAIDSLSVEVDPMYTARTPTGFLVYANTNDPATPGNYYRWTAESMLPRKATGESCGFYCKIGEYCRQLHRSSGINVLSDQSLNGKSILHHWVHRSPIYWFGRHYIEVKQLSLSREAFVFWQKVDEQTARTGSIFDPLPAPLEGNIYNVHRPDELALGYFGASAVSSKRIIIVPMYLKEHLLQGIAGIFIGQGDCSVLYPESVYDLGAPPGWENEERLAVY